MTDGPAVPGFDRLERLRQDVLARHGDDSAVVELTFELSALVEELLVHEEQLRNQADAMAEVVDRLELERHRYRELFSAAPDPYLVTDRSGIVREANVRARENLVAPVEGRPIVLLVEAQDRAGLHRFLPSPTGDDEPPPTTFTFRCPDGARRLEARCRRLGTDELLWLLRDVTEVEEANALLAELAEQDRVLAEQLRELDELRRAFFLTVSHDLRVPLAAIGGLAGLLADQPELRDEDRMRIVDQIRTTAERVIAQFAGLLDLERFEEDANGLLREDVDVAATIRHAVDTVDRGGRDLELDLEPVVAFVDRVLLERSVENLVRTAVQHTPAGARIWVRCRRDRDGVLLVVEDDGDGVAEGLAPTVFDLFERDRRPGRASGLGVGLALVRRFAELHGGFARVEQRPGGGASFHVLFTGAGPDADADERTAAPG
ncbi:MAG: ATP-binding protein [Actinomycetota bacterium]|nr:ATP-binding protein [Actinomycetota bacterium]